jgi:hypothetical protein
LVRSSTCRRRTIRCRTAIVGTTVMADNVEWLNLDWSMLISVHPPNPDRPITREKTF